MGNGQTGELPAGVFPEQERRCQRTAKQSERNAKESSGIRQLDRDLANLLASFFVVVDQG
jgi:hypothetical protein